MSEDLEAQEDELLALESIYSPEEFVRFRGGSGSAGEIRVSVDLPQDFCVAAREGDELRQYEISFLPPLILTFDLPEDYPSSSPPSFLLSCPWLTHTQLSSVCSQLVVQYVSSGGAVVLFSWVQFLREDALNFLNIHSLLELPTDLNPEQRPPPSSLSLLELPTDLNPEQRPPPSSLPLVELPANLNPEQSSTNLSTLNSEPSIYNQNTPTTYTIKTDQITTSKTDQITTTDSSKTDQNTPNSQPSVSNLNALSTTPTEAGQSSQTSAHQYDQNTLNSEPTQANQSALKTASKADQNTVNSGPKGSHNSLSSWPSLAEQNTPKSEPSKVDENTLNSGPRHDQNPVISEPKDDQNAETADQHHADQNQPASDYRKTDPTPQIPHSEDVDRQNAPPAPPPPPPPTPDPPTSPPAPPPPFLSQLLLYNQTQRHRVFAATVFDCGVCFMGWPGSECVLLRECGHVYCKSCLAQFCRVLIAEGNVRGVTCPQQDCNNTPTPDQIRRLVGEELFSRYDRLLLQSTLDRMPDVIYCPRLSCGAAVIMEVASRVALCSVCRYAFCVFCRRGYHGTDDCQAEEKKKMRGGEREAFADLPQAEAGLQGLWEDYTSGTVGRRRLLERRYGRDRMRSTVAEGLTGRWMTTNSKNCPHCSSPIEKHGGCNMMRCSECGHTFCWGCLAKLGDSRVYQHACVDYNS